MFEVWQDPFMRSALIGGTLVALLSGYFGVFVVQRGLSFLGSGLAHAAFGGVALGLLLNFEPLYVALPFTIGVALAIAWVRQRTAIGGDTSVGIFFAVSVALGVVFISLREQYTAEVVSYLFGSILLVSDIDLWIAAGVLVLTLALTPWWSRWAYATFDRELALTDRLHVARDDYLLSVLVAVVVVTTIKLVGIVLIAAFLVIPPAAARLLTRTFSGMTVIAMLLGVVSVIAGLRVSYDFDFPSGATIILVQAVMFVLALSSNLLTERGRSTLVNRI